MAHRRRTGAGRLGGAVLAAVLVGIWGASLCTAAPALGQTPKKAAAEAAEEAAQDAEEAAGAAEESTSDVQAASPEEQETANRIGAAVAEGRYDEAIDLAKASIRTIQNEPLKTHITLLVAQAQRKKKDWNRAATAYLTVRDRFAKGSEEYIRYNAVADVLRAAKGGVYMPLAEAHAGDTSKTVDDDAVLAEALAVMARKEAERLPLRLRGLSSARTVDDLMQRWVPVAEDLRRLRVLWPDLSASHERSAIQALAMRLADLSQKTIAVLRSKQAEFEAMQKSRARNTQVEAAMLQHKSVCEKMIAAEKALTTAMDALPGAADWPEGQKLREDSVGRQVTYTEMAEGLTPGKGRSGGKGGRNWGNRDLRDWATPGGF